MAACTDVAAQGFPFLVLCLCFLYLLLHAQTSATADSRQELLDLGFLLKSPVTNDCHLSYNLPDEIARHPGSPWTVVRSSRWRRRRRERKHKRGCRSGLLARLRKNPHNPPLPSMSLTNTRSLTHKMDELELLINGNRYIRDCCVPIISETWLRPLIPDAAVQLAGHTAHRGDRNKDSGKSKN